jgi:hypothetical protein
MLQDKAEGIVHDQLRAFTRDRKIPQSRVETTEAAIFV